MARTKLFTEAEVAERLVCSVSKIRKLRAAGRLAFLPGRPPLITEEDLKAVLQAELGKVSSRKKHHRERRRQLEEANPPDPAEVQAAAEAASLAELRFRIHRIHLRRRMQHQWKTQKV